jgi:hypothetical protein
MLLDEFVKPYITFYKSRVNPLSKKESIMHLAQLWRMEGIVSSTTLSLYMPLIEFEKKRSLLKRP